MNRWWVLDEERLRRMLHEAAAGEPVDLIIMRERAGGVVEDYTQGEVR